MNQKITLSKIASMVGVKFSPLESYSCSYQEGDISLLIKWDTGTCKASVELLEENECVFLPNIDLPQMIASDQKNVRETLEKVSMIAHMIGTIHTAFTMIRCGA